MARFIPEYKEVDTRPLWEKIAMTVSLCMVCLLVPATVLGYYSEKSLPGQSLYPVKRGIESMVLVLESFTPYGKSLYYQTLATKRVDETGALIAQAEASGGDFSGNLDEGDTALNDIVLSVKESAVTTQSITNPEDKKKAQQQLATSIQKYQSQLTQLHYVIEEHNITPTITPTLSPDNTAATNSHAEDSPISTPTPSPDNTTAATALQNQIDQTQQDLQTITDNLAQDGVIIPSPTPTITPTPTLTPTPTPKHRPTLTPFPTQNPFNFHHNEGGNNQNNH